MQIFSSPGPLASRAARRLAPLALTLALSGPAAWAYRPFDGTDAAVAEEGVFELAAGLGRTRIGAVDSVALPALVFNYGLMRDTEIVLEGQVTHEIGATADAPRNSLTDTQFSMKHVFVDGSLQGGTGASVATECAVLLPEVHGSSGTGGDCAAIVSSKWDALALHLNLGLGRTREHETARTVSLIAEGPGQWIVRPVAELLAERDTGIDGRLDSALVGAICQPDDDLAIDFGFRHARTSDGAFNELRLGLTWSLPLGEGRR
jgi:hypothetical protein